MTKYEIRWIRQDDPPPFAVGDTVRNAPGYRRMKTPTAVVTDVYYYPGAGWAARVQDETGEAIVGFMAYVYDLVSRGPNYESGHAADLAALFGVQP